MHEPETFTFNSQGLRLNVFAWGDPKAPPLILLHGVRDHARAWDGIARAFAPRFRVLAPDLRGHGESEWGTGGLYPSEAYVLDLVELVDTLKLSQTDIIGHSLGGNIGLRYAALFPGKVGRLVAIEGLSHSPKLASPPVETRLVEWIARARENAARPPRGYANLQDCIARVAELHPRLEPDMAAHLARHGARRGADGAWRFKFDPALRVFPPLELTAAEAQRLWAQVACPTLLVYGAQSWASNPAQDGRARHFRDARVVVLEGAGHWPHQDQRGAFLAQAQAFLAEI